MNRIGSDIYPLHFSLQLLNKLQLLCISETGFECENYQRAIMDFLVVLPIQGHFFHALLVWLLV